MYVVVDRPELPDTKVVSHVKHLKCGDIFRDFDSEKLYEVVHPTFTGYNTPNTYVVTTKNGFLFYPMEDTIRKALPEDTNIVREKLTIITQDEMNGSRRNEISAMAS